MIMSEEMTRRSFLKRIFGGLIGAGAAASGGYFYARNIEPHMLDITQHEIRHIRIPSSFDGVKIIQFSDTHLGFQYDLNELSELVGRINKLNPDIIFFTGDLMDKPNEYQNIDGAVKELSRLQAPLGRFSIYGNHDHGGYGSDIYRDMMERSGFTLLMNNGEPITLLDGSKIWVIGVDDAMLGTPDIQEAKAMVPDNSYTILLAHAPDIADAASGFDVQLQLSGHSHGGQIQLPFIGPLVKPPYAEKYYEGFYTLGTESPLTAYVNRGLGTTRLPFRFLSRPELTVFTLRSEEQ